MSSAQLSFANGRKGSTGRWGLLGLVLVCAGLLIAPSILARHPPSSGKIEAAQRPNVLIISLCSVRADHMSVYGYGRETTPNLRALAAEAVTFDEAVTQWPKTVPAVASLLTGVYPHDTGVMRVTGGQVLGDEQQTLGEILASAGYDTAAFLSSAALNRYTNLFQQGFQRVDETYRLDQDEFTETTARAIGWIHSPRQRPFFAWVHYNNAHQPYTAPDIDGDMFVDDGLYDASRRVHQVGEAPLDLDLPPDHPRRMQILRPDIGGVRRSTLLPGRPEELDYYVAHYDAGIYSADREIGRLLDSVREAGLLDSTLVIVVGDHGEALGDHDYFFGHGRFAYEDCLHVPLIIRPPGDAEPRRVAQPVPTFGLAPTVLDLVNLPVPSAMEAPSLISAMSGAAEPDLVFSEAGYQTEFLVVVRQGDWKLIFVPHPLDQKLMTGRQFELYDLESDPGETNNLVDREPNKLETLQRSLRRFSRPWMRRAYRESAGREIDDADLRQRLHALGYL